MQSEHPVDRDLYPFESHYFDTSAGKMHYVDEGTGEPIVFAHGNPTWSFMYRAFIMALREEYRCIAPDHVGFGLSDKPADWSYRPQDHAVNLHALLDSLNLTNMTLVVHDWGGPIGLSYALAHPDKVARLVILNTWMWPLDNAPLMMRLFSLVIGGAFGNLLIRRLNFFDRGVMRIAASSRARFPSHIHAQYIHRHPTPESRKGVAVFPAELRTSRDWLAELWAQREKLADKPALFLWGTKDMAFTTDDLHRWQALIPNHTTITVPSGHYVAEEYGADLAPRLKTFIDETR